MVLFCSLGFILTAQQTISYVQAVDTAADGRTLGHEETEAVLHQWIYVGCVSYVRGGACLYFCNFVDASLWEPKSRQKSLSVLLRCQPLAA